ncbi:IS110 family transposase [Selenomonas sp. oral taxon 126]|uniref:IS110 family transposase n=1 Tax=Selenomonas sp. oral taxon 126 TaxID=712528 RepID=UPI003FA702F2
MIAHPKQNLIRAFIVLILDRRPCGRRRHIRHHLLTLRGKHFPRPALPLHPKYVKAIRGKKTDKKDAKWIADIFKHGLVSGSFIPPADIRQLRDLMRYRSKLTGFSSGEKNRAQNCLTVSNIKLDDVFSDVFGKTASAITTQLLEANAPFDVSPFLSKKLKASAEEIQAAVDGSICTHQAGKMRVIRSHEEREIQCRALPQGRCSS